ASHRISASPMPPRPRSWRNPAAASSASAARSLEGGVTGACHPLRVMRGLGPRIRDFADGAKFVDGRAEPGHDASGERNLGSSVMKIAIFGTGGIGGNFGGRLATHGT